ncbi:hypothetical protein U1Q18_015112, partial [Sarracenia purpurea var. burkii]
WFFGPHVVKGDVLASLGVAIKSRSDSSINWLQIRVECAVIGVWLSWCFDVMLAELPAGLPNGMFLTKSEVIFHAWALEAANVGLLLGLLLLNNPNQWNLPSSLSRHVQLLSSELCNWWPSLVMEFGCLWNENFAAEREVLLL